ncbi:RNA polymerase sigma factor [Nocardia asteroides]|uniref:RNA polymerase sigma factor n=1 Tax=Nocardia asteroides TaxID=1824 RepID=UPI001E3751D6|nr:sigma-70 family RNA polymerase sigma factor [Nocardia asteroides]UGT52845.1 sigma-70 family RNA polymerase sigma factor [Nocardia asteroides]
MSTVNPATSGVARPSADEQWLADLADPGRVGHQAVGRLREVLLRATRHQVWRLRGLLPGAGADELEDLAQQCADDAVLSVLGRLSTFEGRSRFTTWVFKFGVHHAGVAVRKQAWRHREILLPDTGATLADRAPGPEAVFGAVDLARAIDAAIAGDLTPHQRRILLALVVDQVPIDVLADRLGSTRNALYKTLHDARKRLRAALIATGHLDAGPDRSTP